MRFASITERLKGLGSDKWRVHIEGKRRQALGREMIFLSIGEPDFAPPAAIMDVADRQMRSGRTRYSSGRGEPGVLDALSRMYSRRTGRAIAPSQITFLPGTQTALCAAMMALVETGDEVLLPDPYYATYEGVIAAAGASAVSVPTSPDNGFHLTAEDLQAAVTPATRLLLLNTPSNPTGAVLSASEIEAIGLVCEQNDLWIMSDEVYATLIYGATPFASPFDNPRLAERSVVVSSISKSHAMPGFRCGWAVGSQEFSDRFLPLSETLLFGSQPFLEDATAFALDTHFPEVDEMKRAYEARARALVSGLSNAPGIACRMPEGGMFVMVDVRRLTLSGDEFAMRLLEAENVVTMPGESFGAGAAGHLRVALTVDEGQIEDACRRIVRFAERWAA